uniref:Uncharacterized protein n=1 Tax=Tanacetum cinerariifolium TaxID=118510 RepID=A0A699H1N6_TANCI|nr:hypothetical protein [Tanacetum cinerariifolium]
MAKSSSSSENEACCSKSCRKNTKDLNTKITELSKKLSDSKTMLYHYKLGLSQVEARLVEFKNQEIKLCEKIRGLEFVFECKNNRIERLTNKLEELKKEKEGLESKLTVLFPPLTQVYSPPKKDMSWTGFPEFVDDTITDYSRPLPSIETDCPGVIKNNKTETASKPPVKYAEMYQNTSKSPKVRGNQRNWNNLMNQRLGRKTWPKNNFAHKNVTPRADLFKTASVSAARRVNTAASRPNVNSKRPKTTQDLVIIKLIQRVKRLERDKIGRFSKDKIRRFTVQKEVVDYILQVKIKLLIKKLEDSEAEHQV